MDIAGDRIERIFLVGNPHKLDGLDRTRPIA
jgi:hypothetical protein